MTSRRTLLATGAATFLAGVSTARADDPAPFLTARDVDLTVLLPPPPDGARELDQVIAIQAAASPERIAQAVRDTRETVFDMFGPVLGPRFVPADLPLTDVLFARIGASENATVDPAKPFFGRVRPYLADDRVKPLVPPSRSGSWPSGHAARVTLSAVVMTAALPHRRDALWTRAGDYGASRVIGGMHYPSDVAAGQRAGTAMAAVLMDRPDFRDAYGPARDELRAALAR